MKRYGWPGQIEDGAEFRMGTTRFVLVVTDA
jgi:hypothetical protein